MRRVMKQLPSTTTNDPSPICCLSNCEISATVRLQGVSVIPTITWTMQLKLKPAADVQLKRFTYIVPLPLLIISYVYYRSNLTSCDLKSEIALRVLLLDFEDDSDNDDDDDERMYNKKRTRRFKSP